MLAGDRRVPPSPARFGSIEKHLFRVVSRHSGGPSQIDISICSERSLRSRRKASSSVLKLRKGQAGLAGEPWFPEFGSTKYYFVSRDLAWRLGAC